MTNDQIFDILRPIILAVTGVSECILSNPNKPSPKDTDYASIQPQQSITERGQANISRTAGAGDFQNVEIRAQIECRASINFYRGDTRTKAAKLKQCNKRPDVSNALFANKLGWMGTGQVNNLTALQSNNWESRSQIEIVLWYETSDLITINSIESASIEIYDFDAKTTTESTWVDSDLWIDSADYIESSTKRGRVVYTGDI